MVFTECVSTHAIFTLLVAITFLFTSLFYEFWVADLGLCDHTITHINCLFNQFRQAIIFFEIAGFSVFAKSASAKSLKTARTKIFYGFIFRDIYFRVDFRSYRRYTFLENVSSKNRFRLFPFF